MSSSSDQSHGNPPVTPAEAPDGYPFLGPAAVTGVHQLRSPAVPTAVVRAADVPMATISELFDAVFGAVFSAAFERGLSPAGPPFALYTRVTDGPDAAADLETGFPLGAPLSGPLVDEPIEIDGRRLVASELPAAEIAVTTYLGGYDGLGRAWGEFMGAIAAQGRAPGTPFWETYVTEPTPDADPATMRTDLYCVVRTPDDAA